MRLNEILSTAGAHKRSRRIGRGEGSGRGKTSGRGTKGAGARPGFSHRYGSEGGQNATIARLPKRGFNNANFRVEYQVVNVWQLEGFADGAVVDVEALAGANLARRGGGPLKVLGGGEMKHKLTVVATAFSASAEKKIVDAGGTVQRV
jgi:large subunit ribosomal protein L15